MRRFDPYRDRELRALTALVAIGTAAIIVGGVCLWLAVMAVLSS
jgi:hypothetical protein